MAFECGAFLTAWLLAMSSDFLDASFLVTVSLTMYAPCCGWRDNENFFSLDRFLLFVGCSLALILRTVLLFYGVDPLRWDSICHIGAALILLVFFTEVLVKWRRAVYGRSQLGTTLGRRLPEEREGSGAANALSSLEDGRRAAALENGATLTTNTNQTNDTAPAASAASKTRTRKMFDFGCLAKKASHFFVPGILVIFVAAGDGQTIAAESLQHDRPDIAVGECVGLICSTLLAVLLGGFLKWYLHDTHLLFYMAMVFFGLLVTSVQGSIVDSLRRDLLEHALN